MWRCSETLKEKMPKSETSNGNARIRKSVLSEALESRQRCHCLLYSGNRMFVSLWSRQPWELLHIDKPAAPVIGGPQFRRISN
jgi:hypothetical protein